MAKESTNGEPIALVGRSLRFPGASSPSELYDLLYRPRDLLGDFPPLRMNIDGYYHPDGNKNGTTNVQKSYFIKQDHRLFDAAFFNISPIEAEAMDPQQRILLELVYEALESAGLTIDGLQGSRTSVFVGLMSSDYSSIQHNDGDTIPKYALTGTANSILSNRISYFFDWKGPSMTIDTACSSSLVAVHQAVQSLRSGESDLAIVAGANLILNPQPFIAESQVRMLSPTSRCRMWDSRADGYVRGDGFAVVVLKRLKEATADKDHIFSVIRETVVNMDGHTASITMPNPASQATLIREAYKQMGLDCRISSDRCQYFEAHGTGTPTGDPVEAEAVRTAFFQQSENDMSDNERNDCLYIGSIKSIIGHLEGCAGLAGLLKASLAVENGVIFPNMHFDRLNPNVAPFYRNMKIPTLAQPWPEIAPGTPRRASVNSFGFGGTNAHAVVESYTQALENGSDSQNGAKDSEQDDLSTVISTGGPFVFSSNSKPSLLAMIESFISFLMSNSTIDLQSLAWTLQSRRTILPVRAAFSGTTRERLMEALEAYVTNAKDTPASTGTHSRRLSPDVRPRMLGIFTGQGAQWPRMGRELLLASKLFGQVIDNLQESLDSLPDPPSWSIRKELIADPASSRVLEAAVGQPLCTAVQIALVGLMKRAGISFSAVVGHSSGEIAAAYAAGYLSASDAIRVAYYRGCHVHSAGGPGGQAGAMMAVDMSFSDGLDFCQSSQFAGRLVVAASNASNSVTLSGDADAVHEAQALLEESHSVKLLRVDKAYHSHHMDPASEPYVRSLRACNIQVLPGGLDCMWISTVTADPVATKTQIGDCYWADNMVQPVLFSQAVERAVRDAGPFDLIVEIGPHPTLRVPVTQSANEAGGSPAPYCSLLRRGSHGVESFSGALGYIWATLGAQARIDFDGYRDAFPGLDEPSQTKFLQNLPSYPWEHQQTYWKESRISRNTRFRSEPIHQLLGRRRPDDSTHEMRWRKFIYLEELPWLRGHCFQGQVVFPAAGYVSMALEAAKTLVQDRLAQDVVAEVRDLTLSRALILSDDSPGTEVNFSLRYLEQSHKTVTAEFICSSCPSKADAELQVNATGQVQITLEESPGERLPPETSVARSMLDIDVDRFYGTLSELGLDYTGLFRCLREVRRTTCMATASATWPASGIDMSLLVHPAVLDVGFQAVFASAGSVSAIQVPYLPTRIDRIRINASLLESQPETDVDITINAYTTDISPPSKSARPIIRADLDIFRRDCWALQVEGLSVTPISGSDPSNDRRLFWTTAWEMDVSSGIAPSNERQEGSLDDTDLPELVERLAHMYFRQLYAQNPREKVATLEWYQQRLFEYMEDIFSSIDSGRHPIIKKEWVNDTREELFAQLARFPMTIDVEATNAVAERFPAVLAGEKSMIEVLTTNDMLTRIYAEGLVLSRGYNHIARMAKQICHRYPGAKVLEIGAGTGSTTAPVLESIDGAFSSYMYTDISNGFFGQARERFKDYAARMDFKALNIEIDPAEQGFPTHAYDIIVASSCLHATRYLKETMTNVRRLLKPGGYLLLLELTGASLRVTYLMCGLPGWWLGGEDGRQLHPGLSETQWDALLRETGFSGMDALLHDSDVPSKHVYSAILSQAMDVRITMLREPVRSLEYIPGVQQLVIVGGQTRQVHGLVEEICQLLQPWQHRILKVDRLEALEAARVTSGTTVLCLAELDKPVFESMTKETLRSVQLLLNMAKNVLWVTRRCRADNPSGNMMVGVARVLMNETPHLNLQMLDISDEHGTSPSVKALTEALLRLVLRDTLGPDVIWSTEPELALENETLLIPRLLPDQVLNDRLNSNWRSIQAEMPAESYPAEVHRANGSYCLWPRPSLDTLHVPADHVAVRPRSSLLHPIEITPEICAYISLGSVVETGKSVIAFALSNASIVHTRQDWIQECQVSADEEKGFLQSVAVSILARNILSGIRTGGVLLLHQPEMSTASRVAHLALDNSIQVVCTTTRSPPQGSGWIHIHPYASLRQVKSLLPVGIVKLVDFDVEPHDSMRCKLRACMSPFSSELDVTTLFRDQVRASGGPDSNATVLQQTLQKAIRDFKSGANPLNPYHEVMARDLKDAGSKSHRICIIDWKQQNTYRIDIRPLNPRELLRSDRTYFFAGLTGDLGQSIGRWMVLNGARHIVLTSRRGILPPLWLEDMRNAGANIQVFSLDVTDREALSSVYSEICRTMPPIAGVVNGAMVLSDMPFADMTFESLTDVLKPKVDGSKNLDALFRSLDLDFFIMLTSLSGVAGFPGQANYAAANMFMTSLAAQRRRDGLVASVIAIGMLTEIGYVSRAGKALQEHLLTKFPCLPITEPEFHQMFAEAILASRADSHHHSEVVTGLAGMKSSMAMDPDRPPWFDNPRFAHCRVGDISTEKQTESAAVVPISQRLADAAAAEEATQTLQEEFVGRLAAMLQISQSSIDEKTPLIDIGVDSLIAIEIRSWFIKELGVDLPALKTLSGCTAAELCEDVIEKLSLRDKETPNANGNGSDGVKESTKSEVSSHLNAGSKGQENGVNSYSRVAETALNGLNGVNHDPSTTTSQQLAFTHVEPMSYAQSRLWFLVTCSEDPHHFNVVLSYDIRGPLDVLQFQNAFRAVISRHQTFRTCFFSDTKTGKGMQGILKESPVTLEQKQVTSDAEVREEIDRIQRHRFALDQGKLFLATHLRRTDSWSTLVFGYNHIVMDGSSVFIFLQDLNEAYQKQSLEPAIDKYIDFTASQRLLVEDGSLSKELQFWKNEFPTLPEALPLMGISRSRSRSNRGAYGTHTVQATIPPSHALRLKKMSRKLQATPFHFHLTVVQWLLFKFLASTDDVCIGIADANRLDQRFLRTIGIFLNLLPLRFRHRAQETFVDAVTNTSRKVISALEHSRLPFEVMLEELNVERSLAYTPLFQVFVNYRMGAFQHNPLGECEMHHRSVSDAVFAYDLFITITEPTKESCVISFTVRDDIYTEDACGLLVKTYVHLLGQLCENSDQSLDGYSLFSDADARLGMDLGRASRRACRLERTLPRHVDTLCRKVPYDIAVKDGYGNVLKYHQLAEQSLVIAGALSAVGIIKGSYVAVLMHPCSYTIASLLAILRLGAIYVPLDLNNPPDRLGTITADCRPTAIICQANTIRLAETLCTDDNTVIDLTFLPEGGDVPTEDCSQENLPAFALYTSGSTGKPKGVLLSQANILQSVDGTLDGHRIDQGEIVLQQSSLGFDLSLYQIMRAIISGGTLIVVPQALRRNPQELSKLMLAEGVTLTIATPSEYSLLLSYGNRYLKQCTSWRFAASAGENISLQVAQLFRQLGFPGLAILNWFGPTEAGVYSTGNLSCWDMQHFSEDEYTSIGRPIPNVSVYVVDENLQPVPTGFPGELCISGPNVALGYVGDEALTKSKFIWCDFGSGRERLYRSRDKGRILPEGTIVFLGRMESDSQVKLRGFRIDLDDVAKNIIRAAGEFLADAAVSVRGNPRFLVAFVVFSPDRIPADPIQFLEDLCSKVPLPDYMRPSMMVQVSRLPVTSNGKRDRAALDAIPLALPEPVRTETPLNDVETQLRDVWMQTISSATSPSQVGRDTGFFHAGGSSILLMKLQLLIRENFDVKLSLATLFQFSKLGQMATRIEATRRQTESQNGVGSEDGASRPLTNPLSAVGVESEIDWETETDVPEDIVPWTGVEPRKSSSSGKTILLTGSTELMGRRILQQLVEDSQVAKVHCVAVPTASALDEHAKAEIYIGSLSMPNLNLSQAEMERLADEVDLILHASVEGSFLNSYRTISTTSLRPMRHLTRIASKRRIPIHFISSSRVILFSGASSLREISVAPFFPPQDGSEGLAAARWACERYLQNAARKLGVPVCIHRCCAFTSDEAPVFESDVLNAIWWYSRQLKATPILEMVDGYIDCIRLETLVDGLVRALKANAQQPYGAVKFVHHTSGKRIPPKHLSKYFADKETGAIGEVELTEWIRRARELGLSGFAAAFLDAVRRRETVVFFPLLLKTEE
uniref:PKS-NRPS n=1 Tax=Humicola sp. TaxID=1756120 RepID=A0AA51X398_9PEZI|nr:PKS-NRPS [Humicola sp.]